MLCLFYGVDNTTTASGIDAVLVALTFGQDVDVAFLNTTKSELSKLTPHLEQLQEFGLNKVFIVSSSSASKTEDNPNSKDISMIDVDIIGITELRKLTRTHSVILSF